jgi:hypothetical protein
VKKSYIPPNVGVAVVVMIAKKGYKNTKISIKNVSKYWEYLLRQHIYFRKTVFCI